MKTSSTKLFMLDNQDSFTYNLVDEFFQLGFEPVIYRNTVSADFILAQIKAYQGDAMLVISPGPGTPTDAGCLMQLLELAIGHYPVLGICLGHQAIVQHYGGVISRAAEIVHGKASAVYHHNTGPFADMLNPLPVARYHSLVASALPSNLDVIASYNDMPMAVEHKDDAVLGFQFHPESILTTYGGKLLRQSINYLLSLNQIRISKGNA